MNIIFGNSGFLSRSFAESLHFQNSFFVDRHFNVYSNGKITSKDAFIFFSGKKIDSILYLYNGLNINSNMSQYSLFSQFEHETIFMIFKNLEFKKFVYFSSGGSIYKNSLDYLSKENSAICASNLYTLNKINSEYFIEYISNNFDKKYLILRVTNPYGVNQIKHSKNGIISRVVQSVFEGKAVQIFSDPNLKKNYIFINDLIEIANQLLELDIQGLVNIGSPGNYTIYDIIENIESHFESKILYSLKDFDKNVVPFNNISFELLRKYLPKFSYTTFNDSLLTYFKYYE